MKQELINELYQEIVLLLNRKELSTALDKLSTFSQEMNDWQFQEELTDVKTSYEYMLDYMRRGTNDPKRHTLHDQLLAKAYTLNDRVKLQLSQKEGRGLFYEKRRLYEKFPPRSMSILLMELEYFTSQLSQSPYNIQLEGYQPEKLIELSRRHEQAFTELFYLTWCSSFWEKSEQEQAFNILKSKQVQPFVKALFVTALTLGVLNHLDLNKLILLFDACGDTDVMVNQRALVGIAIICYRYDKRLMLYPEIMGRLTLLQEEPVFASDLRTIQMQLFYSRESKRTEKKIKDELLPHFIKNARSQLNNLHLTDEESMLENMEKNPDWEEQLRNSGMEELLGEFQSMMMKGEDVFLASFAQVKNYSFFHEMPNWLLPFTTLHSNVLASVKDQGKESMRILEVVTRFGTLCDSDKYSFSLTIASIPESQKEMVLSQLTLQEEEFKEMSKQLESNVTMLKRESSKHYIQDVYRFLNLNSHRQEFENIFQRDLYLFECSTLQTSLSDSKTKMQIAEFFFRKELWNEAEILYEEVIDQQGGTSDLYQKLGFCMQHQMHFMEALEVYQKADLLNPKQTWVLKNMAYCYRQIGEYEKALSCYEQIRAQQSSPNLALLMQTATCLLLLKRPQDAINLFFEAEFVDEHSPRPWRGIAWCSFVTGKLEQSQRYCQKLLQQRNPTKEDYLNSAHTEWALGHISEAVILYSKALAFYNHIDQFVYAIETDQRHLITQGINPDDIPLMIDLIRSGITRNN